jgi:DNA helicase HerA-like ATPase
MTDFLKDILSIPADGKPISIVDLSGLPSEIVKVIVSLLSRLVLDFAILTTPASRSPILLICEEAQRYLPATQPKGESSAGRQLERIAREGRKYAVSLGLITQRPSELSETALSQCGTIITLRLNNIHDQAKIQAALPEGARSLVELVPALQNRECIICGEGARIPVRVRIDELDEKLRPASDDPVFSAGWNQCRQDGEAVVEVVRRWRGLG